MLKKLNIGEDEDLIQRICAQMKEEILKCINGLKVHTYKEQEREFKTIAN
jgi:hypothetical protein